MKYKRSISDEYMPILLHIVLHCLCCSRPSSADQSSLDRGERMSVCSKEEGDVEREEDRGEERVGREEEKEGREEEKVVDVAVGDLIDISSDPGRIIMDCRYMYIYKK